jgi:chromosome segregation ATPase
MALARHSQKAHAHWKAAEEKHAAAAHALSRERKQRKQLHADLEDTKSRAAGDVAALEKARANLKKWEERMPVINSLMAAVTPMAESVPLVASPIRHGLSNICDSDLRLMRSKLIKLGFDVPRRSYGFGDSEESDKKVQNARANSQARGLSNPRSHETIFCKE